jgi:hypothetical protein
VIGSAKVEVPVTCVSLPTSRLTVREAHPALSIRMHERLCAGWPSPRPIWRTKPDATSKRTSVRRRPARKRNAEPPWEEALEEFPRSRTLEFLGLQGTVARMRLNVGTTDDGKRFRDHHLL